MSERGACVTVVDVFQTRRFSVGFDCGGRFGNSGYNHVYRCMAWNIWLLSVQNSQRKVDPVTIVVESMMPFQPVDHDVKVGKFSDVGLGKNIANKVIWRDTVELLYIGAEQVHLLVETPA